MRIFSNVHFSEEEEVTEIPKASLGRALMMGKLRDKQVEEYLHIYRRKGGIILKVVVIATAKALVERSELKKVKGLDLENSLWPKSFTQENGFCKKASYNRESRHSRKPEIKRILNSFPSSNK